MPARPDPIARLSRRLAWHQHVLDPALEPRNRLRWLKALQSWQALRLERSFDGFLRDPARRPAARFFLTDVYGDHDFSQRDADIAKVIPMTGCRVNRLNWSSRYATAKAAWPAG